MSFGRYVRRLLLVAVCAITASYASCHEGETHDQSGLCVIDPFMPPPFLEFEYWSSVGIALGVLAGGLICAAIMIAKND
jgi:hypothetical protein